jgi:hypothetical protein
MKLTRLKGLLFAGSFLTLVAGLLTAFVPGLAFATVSSYFADVPAPLYGLPFVSFQSLDFGTHIYTARFIFAALGGLLGLGSVVWKSKQTLIGAGALATTGFGLISPAYGDVRATFPEVRLFDVYWTGTFLVLAGLSLMFLGLTIRKACVSRLSFLGVPVSLVVYSISPILVLANNLPWIVFGAPATSPLNSLMLFLMIVGPLLMIWGVLKGSYIRKENNNSGTFQG